jgi:TetR/AcrR family transcriptional repressor of lmrAB and yxaGH operons
MVSATVDLLRSSGLSGAGINQIVEASGAPKGSVYHFFPDGKKALVAAALDEAGETIGNGLKKVFAGQGSLPQRIRTLFNATASRLEENHFGKGCPVAAVTVALDDRLHELRPMCQRVFDRWCAIIESALAEVPETRRHDVAEFILAALEGGLILARAHATSRPLERIGVLLADALFHSPEEADAPKHTRRRAGGRSRSQSSRKRRRRS